MLVKFECQAPLHECKAPPHKHIDDFLATVLARITESFNFLLFNFCNKCFYVEVSNNENFNFLVSNSCILHFC